MAKLLLLLCTQFSFVYIIHAQSFTASDLLEMPSLPDKSIGNFLNRRDFIPAGTNLVDNTIATVYREKKKKSKKVDSLASLRRIEIYKKGDSYFFAFHTPSKAEFTEGRKEILKEGFSCNKPSEISDTTSLLFQSRNITIRSAAAEEDGEQMYFFLLQSKQDPDISSIRYADDLAKFTSHEYLVSFFGEKNVKKDVYYFTETELRKCSVLFGNTSQQAVFVWKDEATLSDLAYVVISGILPTVGASQFTNSVAENKWILKSGLYSGMSMEDLVKLNEGDFEFYGRDSDFSFMINPRSSGNIDFSKTGIMLGCVDCNNDLLDHAKISASTAMRQRLKMTVFYIMIPPSGS